MSLYWILFIYYTERVSPYFYAVFDNPALPWQSKAFNAVRQSIYKTAGIFYESSGGKNMLNMRKRNRQTEKSE